MPGIEELIQDLYSEDEKTRAFAAEDIAYDGLVEGIGPMLQRLEVEESRYVREVIVNSLKTMSGPELVAQVIPHLKSDDAFVRNAGIDILALQGEETLKALSKILHDNDKDIRKFALDILLQIASEQSGDLIAEGLKDSDINNVITAVEYLGRLENRNHVAEINSLFMRTDNVLLRCTCLESLAVIGDDTSVEYINKRYPNYQAISFLEQYSFLKFVAKKGSDLHIPLIIALMREKGQVMHKEIINAIEGILKRNARDYLPDELSRILPDYLESNIKDINKYELLLLMGRFKNSDIFPVLIKYARADNHLLCLAAVEALGMYKNKEALPVLEKLQQETTDEEMLEVIGKAINQL